MTQHVVIGAGQIGKAVAAVLSDRFHVRLVDIGDEAVQQADVIHICFPWSNAFIDEVLRYQNEYQPFLTVIHSTVPVGTSNKLGAVHSPVTGKHPNLEESIRTFVKFFGGEWHAAVSAASDFEQCGVSVQWVPDAKVTEAGKLFQTLQFGLLVAMQKEIYEYCKKMGLDYYTVYEKFNLNYNLGYEAMGEPFVLPTLENMPGPIGGHCVIPNAKITDNRLARMLLFMNEDY